MFLSFLFFAFLAYLLFKLVVNVVIPVYRTARRMRTAVRQMQDEMNNQRQPRGAAPPPPSNGTAKKHTPGDYIDFEEVKE